MSLLGFLGFKGGIGSFLNKFGGASVTYEVNAFDTSGANPSITTYSNVTTGDTKKFTNAGYYVLTVSPTSPPITFDMWTWGAGGATTVSAYPDDNRGCAGGGVRGRVTVSAGNKLTFLVGGTGVGAQGPAGSPRAGGFPDGGTGNGASGYYGGGGGGSSRIGSGTIPFPTRNDAPTAYLLIGGGGAAGAGFLSDGPAYAGYGGYPSGAAGSRHYSTFEPIACCGGGGTQSAGGAAGTGGRTGGGVAGAKYSGGPGIGGGGGGGYYGGGGAAGYYAQAGGGSSFIDPSLTNTASFQTVPGTPPFTNAVDDPANPGIKPATAGNGNNAGVVIFKVV